MRFAIRPVAGADYPRIVDVLNAVHPDYPNTEREMRYQDEHRDAKCWFARWVAENDGAVIGVGEVGHSASSFDPQKFWMDLSVHPDHQGRGVGSALFEHILADIRPRRPISMRTGAREDKLHSVQFLLNRGFKEDMRAWESRLDVASFDPAPFEGVAEKVRAQGIEIKTVRELEADPQRNQKLYDLDWEIGQDIPHPEPLTRTSFEFFVEHTVQNPNFLPDAYFIALDGTEYVGTSNLWVSQGTTDLYTGDTGVKRAYRRRGIALALKLRAIAYAKEHGSPTIRTWNEANNRPMLAINERLGFVKQPAWIDFVKLFDEDPQG